MPLRPNRRRVGVIAISMILAAGALTFGPASTASALVEDPEEVLSHFLCYNGRFANFDEEPVIGIEDQFSDVAATVGRAIRFCNPAKKTHAGDTTPIVSRRQHLKAYLVGVAPTLGKFDLLISNQFGTDQEITVDSDPDIILVPTRKRPHRRPRGLDHFACYDVDDGQRVGERIKLRDQFRRYRRVRVRDPILVCNPFVKTHDGKTTPVRHREAHLVCYTMKPRDLRPRRTRWTANQFERSFVRAKRAFLTCVPSTKVVLPAT